MATLPIEEDKRASASLSRFSAADKSAAETSPSEKSPRSAAQKIGWQGALQPPLPFQNLAPEQSAPAYPTRELYLARSRSLEGIRSRTSLMALPFQSRGGGVLYPALNVTTEFAASDNSTNLAERVRWPEPWERKRLAIRDVGNTRFAAGLQRHEREDRRTPEVQRGGGRYDSL